ncbi:hypothetical protein [Dysgonomonas sp. 511]|uniref:hypothetical protein n=1 Tax=Dysgonomonas sp. 511 TaxID=2302930 RepID=UPI0013D12EC1|nr:hypothetical protein [Dysgonomonas sp. 511]NDV77854.1 hypothetical protein [Dysgonomonas sp. 511]
MSILDNILGKRKKGVNSFLPTNDQDLQEEVIDTSGMHAANASEQNNEQPLQQTIGKASTMVNAPDISVDPAKVEIKQPLQSAALPEVKYPNKPQGLNDGEYEHLLKYYSPEAITNFSAPFDPSSGGNILQRYYESTMAKPAAPDEKKLRNRRTIAGIADGLSMLSQMISAGKGAHMRERNDFALPKVTAQGKEEQNRYLQLSQRYNDGLFQARIKDFQKALDDYNNGRKGVQGVLAAKQKMDQAQAQFEDKQRYAYDKLAQDKAKQDADREAKIAQWEKQNGIAEDRLKETARHNKANEGIAWARVKDSQNRTSAYVRNINMGGGKNGLQLMIAANPNDSNATTNELGEKVKVFTLTKDEASSYARAAKADPSFFDRHPHLVLSRPDRFTGSGKTTYAKDDEIAAAYAKEIYDSGYTNATEQIPVSQVGTWSPSYYNFLENNPQEWTQGDPSELNPNEADEWGKFAMP